MIEKNERQKHVVDVLFVLALFAFFAVASIMLIALGAGVYRRNVEQSKENYDLRANAAYVSQKIRQNDFYGAAAIEDFDGLDALVLKETVNDVSYSTRLYFYDGYLCELFSNSDLSLPVSAGTKIMPLSAMYFTALSEDLTRIDFVEQSGRTRSIYLKLRSDAYDEEVN